jgi:hypothetical protein
VVYLRVEVQNGRTHIVAEIEMLRVKGLVCHCQVPSIPTIFEINVSPLDRVFNQSVTVSCRDRSFGYTSPYERGHDSACVDSCSRS